MAEVEKEARGSTYYDIWQLTPPEVDVLTQEVRRSSGEVYVFVHPFYICEGLSWNEDDPEYGVYARPKQEKAYVEILRQADIPVILFEERGPRFGRTQRVLAEGGVNKQIYLIPTVSEDPQPAIVYDRLREVIQGFPEGHQPWEILLEDPRVEELSWNLTLKKLASFGITNMRFTGRSYPGGCAETAERYLKKRFSVEVIPETHLEKFLLRDS